MMILRYLLYSLGSIILTGISQFSFIWALFVNKEGQLPRLLSWLNPPDSAAWGDQSFWKNEVPSGGWYQPILWYWRSVLWLRRNGAQGYDLRVAGADEWVLNELAMIKIEGDLTITGGMEVAIDGKTRITGKTGWFKVTIGKYWHYRNIKQWPFGIYTSSEFGWRLQGIAEGNSKDICRQLVFTPARLIKFVR